MADVTRFTDLELTDYATNAERSAQEISAQLNALISYLEAVTPTVWSGAAAQTFSTTIVPAIQNELNGLVTTLDELAADVRTSSLHLDAADATANQDVSQILTILAGISSR